MKKLLPAMWLGCLGAALLVRAPAAQAQPAAPAPPSIAQLQAELRRPNLPDTVRGTKLVQLADALEDVDLPAARRCMLEVLALVRKGGASAPWQRRKHHGVLYRLGIIEQKSGHYPAAERWLDQSMRLSQQRHDTLLITYNLMGMAILASINGEQRQALRYFAQGDTLLAALHTPRPQIRVMMQTNMGNVYLDLHDYPAAERIFRRGYAGATRVGAPPSIRAGFLGNLAIALMQQQQYAAARQAVLQAQALNQPEPDNRIAATLWNTLAEIAQEQGQPQAAEQYARQALHLAENVGYRQSQQAALLLMAHAQAAQRPSPAYTTLARYLVLHDTLVNRDRSQAIATAHARFNDAEQQAQIRALQQDRRLAAQTLELASLRQQRQLAGGAALLLLTLAAGGGLLWRYRRQQAQRETALRNRLAADLHDDVGGLLSQISMQSGLLQEGLADPASQRVQLGQISEASRSAVRQLNDVVWSLDAHNDTLPNLLDRMRDYAFELLPPAGIEVNIDVAADLPTQRLPVLLRRNLYLIYKEALHNVLKHAHEATQLRVSLRQQGPLLVLEVEDDGRLAATPAPGRGRRTGHGLRNMRARAASVGGEVQTGLSPTGTGYSVRVALPLAVA